jgi:Tfp pilus assembly protein PilF
MTTSAGAGMTEIVCGAAPRDVSLRGASFLEHALSSAHALNTSNEISDRVIYFSSLTSIAHPPGTVNTPAHPLQTRYFEQRSRGELAAATETLKTVLKSEPRADWAYNEFIELLYTSGRHADALALARTALRINPRNAQGHNLFATVLSQLNDLPAGEWHFRRAIEIGGEQQAFLANLALNLLQQGRTEESETCFARAHALAPGDFRTLAHWSKLREVRGDHAGAWDLLDRAARVAGTHNMDLLRANHLARAGKPAEALALLDTAPALNGDARLERGRLLDRLGRYDEAWRDMVEGKRLLAVGAGNLTYSAQAVETFFARLKRFFVRANIELLPQASVRADVPQPIFIMGFPRSGTTLIEQVLASHSTVRAGGELSFCTELRQFSLQQFGGPEPFPDNLARTWTADNRWAATLFRDYYLARAGQYGLLAPGKQFFTDKMPFNEIWLPLIRMAFPHAKIVRVLRHPLDVCVSMLANNMTHGFNCGYRIEDIVHHLLAVSDLDAHYARELAAGELELHYERFVAEQRHETVRLLDHLGLALEPACLSFHENPRYAPTPSYAQVTQQLNDRSIGRHRHYAAQLAPFLPQLQTLVAARGY